MVETHLPRYHELNIGGCLLVGNIQENRAHRVDGLRSILGCVRRIDSVRGRQALLIKIVSNQALILSNVPHNKNQLLIRVLACK